MTWGMQPEAWLWGSEQQEVMQEGMRADSSPGWALGVGRSTGPLAVRQWGRYQISHPTPTSTFCTVCLG